MIRYLRLAIQSKSFTVLLGVVVVLQMVSWHVTQRLWVISPRRFEEHDGLTFKGLVFKKLDIWNLSTLR